MIRLIILLLALPLHVIACSCGGISTYLTIKDYNDSQFILSGRAVKVTYDSSEAYYKQRKIEFRIDKIYKGNIHQEIVTVHTATSDASCGLPVRENEEWIIWAYFRNDTLMTNLCTRSVLKKYISKKELKALNYFRSNPSKSTWKDQSGKLIAIGKIKDNLPQGYWTYFYKNGYVESEGYYKNGVYTGKWIKYFDRDGITARLRYNHKIPTELIPDLQWLKNKIREITNYTNGLKDGEQILFAYDSTDKPKEIINYKNDLYHGKLIRYYDSGLIFYELDYKDGKLDGNERFYHSNGQLKQEGKFIQEKPSGKFNVYDADGKLIETTYDKRPE